MLWWCYLIYLPILFKTYKIINNDYRGASRKEGKAVSLFCSTWRGHCCAHRKNKAGGAVDDTQILFKSKRNEYLMAL